MAAIGELALGSVGRLAAALHELRIAGIQPIILDLRQLEFLDCLGLSLILAGDEQARRRGREFSLIAGPPVVQRLFDLTSTGARLRFLAA